MRTYIPILCGILLLVMNNPEQTLFLTSSFTVFVNFDALPLFMSLFAFNLPHCPSLFS